MKLSKTKQLVAAVMLGVGAMSVTSVAMPQTVYAASDVVLKVNSVTIEGVDGYKAEEVKRLLPEIKKSEINVTKLSKEIQLVNDSKSFKLTTEFQTAGEGVYNLVVKVTPVKTENGIIGVNNTGNEYTGEWRTSISYVDTDITNSGDTLGLAYVTSPNHLSDVHQVGVSYKWLMPKLGDTAYISYSHSDVDMGTIASFGGVADLTATGKGNSFGLHYQHNMKYTKAKKQILDFGIEHKKYNGDQIIHLPGGGSGVVSTYDFNETLLSLSYVDISRWNNQAFSYNVGYVQNLNGDETAYNKYRMGATKNFKYIKAGANYQYRTASDWLFGVRANAQFTNDDLLGTEQLGAGGASSVRGFKERSASGDKGVVGNFEMYTPEMKGMPNQRFLMFFDVASLSNNHYNLIEKSRNLSSVGIGYRMFDLNGLSVSLDYAKVINEGDVNMDRNYRPWSLNVSYKF